MSTVTTSRLLHQFVHNACRLSPNAVAVIYVDENQREECATYANLLNVARSVELILRSAITSASAVGLLLDYSCALPAILVGVLSSGNYFLFVDQFETPEFIRSSIARNQVQWMICSKATFANRTEGSVAVDEVYGFDNELIPELCLFRLNYDSNIDSQACLASSNEQIAYAMQTSGTTGDFKTVRVPHSCIVPNILDFIRFYAMTSQDLTFLASPLTFDPSMIDIFTSLSVGATLLIVADSLKRGNPSSLASILFSKYHVTILQLTPSLFRRFPREVIKSLFLGQYSSLRVLSFGGEICPRASSLQTLKHPLNRTRIFNLYGITEVSCWQFAHEFTGEDTSTGEVLLGNVLSKTEFFLLPADSDKGHELEGDQSTEEIFQISVGGAQRRCLVDNESWQMAPLLRQTGDLVRRNAKGQLFFVGRSDFQIKRLGKRINLSQLGSLIESHSSVGQCCVMLVDSMLIAFVTPSSAVAYPGCELRLSEELHVLLSSKLPSYCKPDKILFLSALPITKHGKIDRSGLALIYFAQQGLPEFSPDSFQIHFRAMLNDMLNQSNGLHLHNVDDRSSFRSLGGDSLRAVQLIAKLEAWTGHSLPLAFELLFSDLPFASLENYIHSVCSAPKSYANGRHDNHHQVVKKLKSDSSSLVAANAIGRLSLNGGAEHSSPPSPQHCSHGAITSSIERANRLNLHKETFAPTCLETSNNHSSRQIQLNPRWSYNTGKCIDASPLVLLRDTGSSSQETAIVIIGSHSHRLSALSLSTGREIWFQTLGGRIEASAVCSPCAVYVIVGAYDGFLYFLKIESGEIYWQFQTNDAIKSSAFVLPEPTSKVVFVASYDKHVYCLNYAAKTCLWAAQLNGAVMSTGVYYKEKIYVATLACSLFALDATSGGIEWRLDLPKPIFASIALIPASEVLLIGCVDGLLYFVGLAKAEVVCKFETAGPIFATPSVVELNGNIRILVCSHDHHAYCLDFSRSVVLWKLALDSELAASAFCFQLDDASNADSAKNGLPIAKTALCAFASKTGKLAIAYGETGKVLAWHDFEAETFSSPIVIADSSCGELLLLQGCRNDNLYCLAATIQ